MTEHRHYPREGVYFGEPSEYALPREAACDVVEDLVSAPVQPTRLAPAGVGRERLRLFALLVALWLPAAVAAQLREPNAFELAYTAIALDTDMHELCAKISPLAESRFLFNSPGTRIYRERSRCYLYVAVNSLNPYLCRQVVEAQAWFHDGSYFSRQNCEQLVARGRPFNFTVSFEHALILKKLGYDEAEVRARFPRETQVAPWHRFYLEALGADGGEFQRRLRGLPDFAS